MPPFLARIPQSLAAATIAAVATAAIIGGYSATLADHDSNTIHACMSGDTGAVRIVSSADECNLKIEKPIEWNQKGPQGDPGPQGPAGVIGALGDMNGIACEANGVDGTLSVRVDQDGSVAFDCLTPTDADGDSYTVAGGDCDDNNAAIHPGAAEVENGVDDDCDGVVDDGLVVQLTVTPPSVWVQPFSGFAFMVTNEGSLTANGLTSSFAYNPSGFFVIDGGTCGATLAPGETCLIPVSYHPASGQRADAEIEVDAANGDPTFAMLFGQ